MFELISTIPFLGGFLATVIPFIIVLSIVVFVHEYGHYIVGRWCGIEAEVFSVGFGPVIWSREDKRGTVWQVAAVPMGGYVKFLGDKDAASTSGRENLEQLSPEEAARRFHTAPLPARAATAFAGPAFNFILSAVIFMGLLFWTGTVSNDPVIGDVKSVTGQDFDLKSGDTVLSVNGKPVETFEDVLVFGLEGEPTAVLPYEVMREGDRLTVDGPYPMPALIEGVEPLSPANKAGLKAGDWITAINGEPVYSFEQLRDLVQVAQGQALDFTVLRDGESLTMPVIPESRDRNAADGGFEKRVIIGVYGGTMISPERLTPGIGEAAFYGVDRTWAVITGSVSGLYHMIKGDVGVENLQGPLGIAQVSGQTAQMGLYNLVALIAVISTAIGFINLFPIPVLDGGHLLMFAIEGIRGKPLNDRIMRYATVLGLSLLLTLMVFSTFNDIMRL